jgi:amino acid transporter
MKGVFQGVSAVFFAYIGFDAISTTAEECENPQRDLPRGMIYSLLICTIIYVIITLVITGLVNYSELEGVADPLAYVFNVIGMSQVGLFISVIAVVASTSVLLVFQVGQPRIWMSMSRDGLLPSIFGKLNKKSKVPGFATIITGLLVGLPALFIDELLMTDLTSIGTLFAFILVCGGVLMLPVLPEKKGFKLPYINGKWIVMSIMLLLLILFRDRIHIIIVNFEHINAQEILFILFLLIGISLAVITFFKTIDIDSGFRNFELFVSDGRNSGKQLVCFSELDGARSYNVFFI